MSIDPRLIERRKYVAEDNAKRNMGRLLKFLVLVLAVGALVWLAFSPWLSVSQVETSGIEVSSGYSILAEKGVVAGRPMFQVNASAAESALLEDPWIAAATVRRDWPDRIRVEVIERSPVAWVNTDTGWARRAVDGVGLPSAEEPDDTLARVDMPELADVAAGTAPDLLAALEFVDSLPSDLRPDTTVSHHDGELWASISGYQVRLGRPVEMREKALSLQALMAEEIPAGSVLVLIAPTNPAVMTPNSMSDALQTSETTDAEGEGTLPVTPDESVVVDD